MASNRIESIEAGSEREANFANRLAKVRSQIASNMQLVDNEKGFVDFRICGSLQPKRSKLTLYMGHEHIVTL